MKRCLICAVLGALLAGLPGRVDVRRRAAADACLVILAEEVVVR